MEKSSWDIVLNISFCVSQKNDTTRVTEEVLCWANYPLRVFSFFLRGEQKGKHKFMHLRVWKGKDIKTQVSAVSDCHVVGLVARLMSSNVVQNANEPQINVLASVIWNICVVTYAQLLVLIHALIALQTVHVNCSSSWNKSMFNKKLDEWSLTTNSELPWA